MAIQPGHALVTTGLYGVVRHPSYLGLLVNSLGWAFAFRSVVGVLLTALLVPPLATPSFCATLPLTSAVRLVIKPTSLQPAKGDLVRRRRRGKLFQPGSSHWSIRYSDGKADPALVERWINIPYSRGMIHLFHPGLVKRAGVSRFMWQGDEDQRSVF
jgi:hypothetical protein